MTISQWAVDPAHSSVDFSIRHLMIAKVKGSFQQFSAEISADPNDLTTASVQFTIDLSSIDTKNADRDAHLRTADFFDVENNPTLTFKAVTIVSKGDSEYDIIGDLSLHGVTRRESFALTFEGTSTDPWGNSKAGFSATGSLKRSDYGLTYNAALETGGMLLGDDVKISLEIEVAKQA